MDAADLSRQPAPGSQSRGPPESISTRVWRQLSLPSHHGLLLTSRHSKKAMQRLELSNTSGVTSGCRVGPEGAFKPPGPEEKAQDSSDNRSEHGARQGTVLSPFLFTLYTSDFSHNSDSCHLQKFSDDTAIVGRVSEGKELEYREVITNFGGLDIEIVEEYKYLGVHLNNKLDWTHNTDALYKKGQSRLHLLRRLRSFGVIFYAVVCWSCGRSERDRKRLNKLVRRAGSVLDCSLDSIDELSERRMLAKLTSIMDTPSHPLHETVGALSSSFSSRLLHPGRKRERYHRSFIPTAVRLLNMHNS
ncbi:hypothetical protein D4764_07G0005150 [Takifugu flavidus]|uniref:Alkylated DNA repair protein AlkB homologue 8 N-terminal domain-containing protein n=1 Tax=Takifugu flavidus TaxID=433684 RepID=A0A5C6MRS4_9TELE|nr:hypothetical protein D4764_07G0005150 [Takifugu flavidus]